MSWYSLYKKEWKEIIETISNEIKRDSIMIEKDTIQSMFLYELQKYDFPFVFKGGTSLSKVFGLIERFSEDIDLSLINKPNEIEKRKYKDAILSIANKLGFILSNSEKIMTRYDYNKYIFTYDSLFTEEPLEIIIETSYFQNSYPVCKYKVNSFIGTFCKKNNIKLPIPYEAIDFEFNIQTLERTLIDKVFAVCDYKIENMWDRDSRHLYDIAKILPCISFDESFKSLIVDVRKDRMNSKSNPSANLKYDINNLLNEIIKSRFFEADYKNLTTKLLYEDFSYDKAINEGIKKILQKNMF